MPTRLPIALVLVAATALPAAAHQPGLCTPTERCERWTATYDDPSIARSDQFATQVLVNATTVFTVVKDVALPPDDPYSGTATAVVVAYDKATGAVRWTVNRADRVYNSPHEAVLSPDGTRLYVSGAAYDGFPVGTATDSRLTTTAYDAATGAVLWARSWDNRPDGTDNAKGIAVAPDGDEVYVTGVTTTPAGDLDYVTLGYRASDGRSLWQQIYGGPKEKGQDAPFGIAVTPDGRTVAVTGWSDGTAEYDADYATVAYDVSHKKVRQLWVQRYDGIGVDKSDRAMGIAADASRFYVTGDSYAGTTGSGYDYATVAYDARTGAQAWDARWSGGRGGFNSPTAVAAAGGKVVVTGQATAASSDDGNDAGTVAFDALTGNRLWHSTFGPPRTDDYGRAVALSRDGSTAYVVTSDVPIVKYTALAHMSVIAYDTATGLQRWTSTLDPASGDALHGASVAAYGDTVAVAGDVQRGANPLGPPDQNVYDVLTAAFPA